jgi:hypothetical protein
MIVALPVRMNSLCGFTLALAFNMKERTQD